VSKGIILTLDWSFASGRDWGSPWIPDKIGVKAIVKLGPEVALRPRWFWSFAKTGHMPGLLTPNMAKPGEKPPTFFGAYYEWMQSPLPSWDDVAWLRSAWEGPFMVKGVSRIDDAKRVVDLGATALSVSNHVATISTVRRPRFERCRPSWTPWVTRSRSCSTVACVAAATWSRRSLSARAR